MGVAAPMGLHLTYAPACRKRSPTSASSLRREGDGVSPPGRSVAFFALNTRTHRPAAQASSRSSSVQGCPRACPYATRKNSDCFTSAQVFGAPVAVNTAEATPCNRRLPLGDDAVPVVDDMHPSIRPAEVLGLPVGMPDHDSQCARLQEAA